MIVVKLSPHHPAEEDDSAALSQISSCSDDDNSLWEEGLLLTDHVLINGVGRREAEDEGSHRNHDDG